MSNSSCETLLDETWVCFECFGKPIDAVNLECQALIREATILLDTDFTEWVVCEGCDKHFHLVCVDNIPDNATEQDIEASHYLCSYCG